MFGGNCSTESLEDLLHGRTKRLAYSLEKVEIGVITAGGRGTRLGARYAHTQKCLLPISGIPMLEYAIHNLRAAGCRSIFVLGGHEFEQLSEYVKSSPLLNDVICLDANARETAKAVGILTKVISSPFLYYEANVLSPTSLTKQLVERHEHGSMATLAVGDASLAPTHARVMLSDSTITAVDLIPHDSVMGGHDEQCLIGIGVFTPSFFETIEKVSDEAKLAQAVGVAVEESSTIIGYRYDDRWFHVATEKDLDSARYWR